MGNRWDINIAYKGKGVNRFLNEYYKNRDKSILYILGKGFDPRMNNGIKLYADNVNCETLDCLLVDFPSVSESRYKELIGNNYDGLKSIIEDKGYGLIEDVIKADFSKDYNKALKEVCRQLNKFDCQNYTDIIIDISSLPRSIYFNLIKTIYKKYPNNEKNILVFVSENVEMDRLIQETNLSEMEPIFGFRGNYNKSNILKGINVSIPIIGEGKTETLKKILDGFDAEDVCPVLPFPSQDLRRSENLLYEYCEVFKDRLMLEHQDFAYVDEKNPFELYTIINNIIDNYQESLKPLGGELGFGISILASKLLSLGALFVALDDNRRGKITIFNVKANDYTINKDEKAFIDKNTKSESHLVWVTGDAYK